MILMHAISWLTAIVIFISSYLFLTMKKEKLQKITHMILRLFYIFILGTGLYLLGIYQFMGIVILKSLLGVIVIGMMEKILVRGKKEKPIKLFIILFILSIILTFYLGYHVI